MSRINECESCLEGPTRETEFYDNLGAWEGQYPLLCWRCGGGAKLEQSRIIKLLEDELWKLPNGMPAGGKTYLSIEEAIALIKGENK